MTTPGENPDAPSEFQRQLDAAVASYISEHLVPVVNQLKTQTASILKQAEDSEARVSAAVLALPQRAADILAAQAQGIRQQQMAQLEAQAQTVTNGKSPTPSVQGGATIQGIIATIVAHLPAISESLIKTYTALATLGLEKEKVKLAATNPIALARVMAEHDPLMARYMGMALSPDPMQAQIPGIMANTADATTRAITSGMLRAGWTPPGGIPVVTVVPSGAGVSGGTQPPFPSGSQRPGPGSSSPPTPSPTGSSSGAESKPQISPSNPSSAEMHDNPARRENLWTIWAGE